MEGHGFVVLAACGSDEAAYALKDKPYSAFTYALSMVLADTRSLDGDLDMAHLSKEIDRRMSELCTESRLSRSQKPVCRYDRNIDVFKELAVARSQPRPEILLGSHPLLDPAFISRLKKGVGVVFVADNEDLAAKAASSLRTKLLGAGVEVFGPERSRDLAQIIDQASTLEAQKYEDLSSRYLLRGKVQYEVSQITVQSTALYRATVTIQLSLLDLAGNILAEGSSDFDGDPLVVAASFSEIALQRAVNKALDRFSTIIGKTVNLSKPPEQ